MRISDDDVKTALAAYKACDDFEHECMRVALEAALGANEPKCDSDLLKHLRVTAKLTAQGMKNSKPEDYLEGQAAACIEDLAAALISIRHGLSIHSKEDQIARSTLERWRLK